MLSFAVIGTGALGAYFGGRLAAAGNDVHFLFHSEYAAACRSGLTVHSVKGDFCISPDALHAYDDPSRMPKCDVVLVTLKTTANDILRDILPQVTKPDGIVVLIQNGLNVERHVQSLIASSLPSVLVCGGMAFICAYRVAPAVVNHDDYGALTIAAEPSSPNFAHCVTLAEQTCQAFSDSGVEVSFTDQLLLKRWEKLVWNIPYNGLCSLLNADTGALQANPDTRALVRDLMTEVVNAAHAGGVGVRDEFIDRMLSFTDSMRPYLPSMTLDFRAHRPLELEYIYRQPLLTAPALMPKTAFLYQSLSFLNSQFATHNS